MFWKEACSPPVDSKEGKKGVPKLAVTHSCSGTDPTTNNHLLHKTSQPKAVCLIKKKKSSWKFLEFAHDDTALTTPISDKHFLSPHSFW